MTRRWVAIDEASSREGVLELRKRGDDFLITLAGRILMNSHSNRSELALAELGCRLVESRPNANVLIGGLGMGFTLRRALDVLPATARVVLAELNPVVVEWCRGPLAGLTNCAIADSRVEVKIENVSHTIGVASKSTPRFDAILLDLYEGPPTGRGAERDPIFGVRGLREARAALSQGGVFAVWAENPDLDFEQRVRAAGFELDRRRPGRGGLRHAVYIARRV